MGSEYLEGGLAGRDRHHGIPLQLIPLRVLAGAMRGHISAPCLEVDSHGGPLASPTSPHGLPRQPHRDALRRDARLLMFLQQL